MTDDREHFGFRNSNFEFVLPASGPHREANGWRQAGRPTARSGRAPLGDG